MVQPCIAIQNINKIGKQIQTKNLSRNMLTQQDGLPAGTTAKIGNTRMLIQIINKALRVTSRLPGPCRSTLAKYSQIKLKSNSWIDLFSLLMMF